MLIRIFFSLWMSWRYRKILKVYRQEISLQAKSVLDINPFELKMNGIRVIAIDFDGVLVCHGETHPEKKLVNWLNFCVQAFDAKNVFILSNKPSVKRANYFTKNFPGVEFVRGVKKKPYPEALLQIIALKKVLPEQVLVVDDRLLTGILAAILAKTKAIWITKPYICLLKRPFQEIFFIIIRKFERWIFSCP